MHGLDRKLKQRITELLNSFPAVALLGPRQCGKTTLAFEIKKDWPQEAVYLDLENAADLAKLDDCTSYLRPLEKQLVIMDEVQHRPALFPEIRGLIDEGRRKGLRTAGRAARPVPVRRTHSHARSSGSRSSSAPAPPSATGTCAGASAHGGADAALPPAQDRGKGRRN